MKRTFILIMIWFLTYFSNHINSFLLFRSLASREAVFYGKLSLSVSKPTLDGISRGIAKAIDDKYDAVSFTSSGGGGGGGAQVGVIIDKKGQEYFIKTGSLGQFDMLNAEFQGILEIYNTNTMKVPKPITVGTVDYSSFVVFEKLSLGGYGKSEVMAKNLAAMHRCTSPDGKFGWKMSNTVGATFQPNDPTEKWSDFWDEHRLGHMLNLAKMEGATFSPGVETQLREKVKKILDAHDCVPSLVHGDLWSGNQAFTKKGEPVIFDPALYVSPFLSLLYSAFSIHGISYMSFSCICPFVAPFSLLHNNS